MRGSDPLGSPCRRCGRTLTRDEAAATARLIDRGTKDFYCTDCLADRFRVEPRVIREKIAQFREMGCTLFDAEA